jgi:hypothetical protein
MKRCIVVAGVATLVAGLIISCRLTDTEERGDATVSTDKTAQIEEQLKQKPPFETALADYRNAVQDMANHIAALTPGNTWTFGDDTWLACGGDYITTNARHVYLMAGFTGPVPDTAWPQALQIVKDGAARFGATEFLTFHDEPNNHDISIAGPDGVEFRFGTQVASSLTAQSDCRLKQTDIGPG